jgi:hypothetical protein
MYQQLQRFVSTFRNLEKKEYELSNEQEESWRQLKEKLSTHSSEEKIDSHSGLQTIVVIGLYPRTGSSFIASNYAFYLSGKSISTTLCELPGNISTYYLSLDFEKRTSGFGQDDRTLFLQGRRLRIKAEHPHRKREINQPELMNWFFTQLKNSNLLIVDISSYWKTECASWLMGMADQIWVVIDNDFPRLTQTVFSEAAPTWWKESADKIRIILNKWSPNAARGSVLRKVEGTLSMWNEQLKPEVSACIPALNGEMVMKTQMEARLFLEMFPDKKELLDELACLDKGRFL